ncbi:MAG: hypothetical protein H6625_03330 [Bdellovibrionaceae bacterium]|nr:hypothetical protein [Pseudobdellovibrionaceae bacterium]
MGRTRDHARTLFYLPLYLIFSIFISACGNTWEERTPSEYDRAVQFIDQKDYNSAILILGSMLQKNSNDQQARILLSSAYVGRSGLSFRKLIAMNQNIGDVSSVKPNSYEQKALKTINHLKSKNNPSLDEGQNKTLLILEKIYAFKIYVNNFLSTFAAIPSIQKKSQVLDLQNAIDLLEASTNLSTGLVLYRGLLRLVVFNYNLTSEYNLKESINCKTNVYELSLKINDMFYDIKGILSDLSLGIASKKKKKIIKDTIKECDQYYANINNEIDILIFNQSFDLKSFVNEMGGQCE